VRARNELNVGGGIHEHLDAIRRNKTSLLAQALHPIDKLTSCAGVNHILAAKDNETVQ